jgi:methyl-accepting chemotaxis protein
MHEVSGAFMLNRLTVSALLKTVILTTALFVVIGCSLNASDSWRRFQVANRISLVADASASLFKAMHNLRTDRTTTNRLLNSDQPVDGEVDKYLRGIRGAEMPAMSRALELLPTIQFAQQETLIAEFDRLFKALSIEQKEFWDEVAKPKVSRSQGLAKQYTETVSALFNTLKKLSETLSAEVNHQDAMIDQLLMIKQIAWLLRNTAGETSNTVVTALNAGKLTPEGRQNYMKQVGGIETAWHALEVATEGMQLPPPLSAAMTANKSAYFDPQYAALRDRLMAALASGEKPELAPNQWTPLSVGRLYAAVGVAEAALDAAKEHTEVQRSAAQYSLVLQLVLLALAIALPFAAMMAVGRRVIKPLHNMRDAMLKVAAGDLTVNTGYMERRDEIGALAGALESFKQQATDKVKIEAQERERNAGTAARQRTIDAYVAEFEGMVRDTLQQLDDASTQMRTTSSSLSTVSRQTNERVQVAEKASGEASMNVESVASASEELSASINDISQQAAHAAGIAARAVGQARETDGTVQGLARSAGRIGEVVGLINTIAAQTNLLALNATIEAARAGEAGRGFAVVASEVKSLASQTAKATDEISEQIADIQKVAGEAIDAIKGIGSIIGEVNEVATTIAAAVQEQGAATQEITRSTQYAAQGTKNVSQSILGVKTDADAAAVAAEHFRQASDTLQIQSHQLGSHVTEFLAKIRAA